MAEKKSQQPPNTYWLERDGGGFVLYVNDQQRATVNSSNNAAVILNGGSHPAGKLTAPHSQVIYDVVEKRLGIGRVDQFRSKFGPTMINWRGMAERRAESYRRAHPGDAEPKFYLERALKMLNEQSTLGGLSCEGAEARTHICRALMAFDREGKWTANIQDSAEKARSCLRDLRGSIFEEAARTDCARAAAHEGQSHSRDADWETRIKEARAARTHPNFTSSRGYSLRRTL